MSQPFSTLTDLLRWRAESRPAQIGYSFLGERLDVRYGDLDRRARAIGAALQADAHPGSRVLLVYPPDPEFLAGFLGCLYAGCAAVPAHAPHPALLKRSFQRVRAIAEDVEPRAVLTSSRYLPILQELGTEIPAFRQARWLATDALPAGTETGWKEPSADGKTLAFIQYSSGSTGSPKGVLLTHANLLYNLELIRRAFGHDADSRGVIWLPPYHDMGLIGGILQPLYVGFPVAMMSPLDFLKDPYRWMKAVSDFRATTSGGPNFAYELCLSKIPPEQREGLDLSCWEVAFNGAERVRRDTMDRFAEFFAPCGFRKSAFYPCYGLAEATLIVSGGRKGAGPICSPSSVVVGCGKSLDGQRVLVVDPETGRPCGSGQVGEIWVSGPSVAAGYWNQPEATERTFGACAGAEGGSFLRTGDMGFLRDGELFVTGRLKDLIIIRGRNHYPDDIEETVQGSCPAVRAGGAAAFSLDDGGEERLVVLAELDRAAAEEPAKVAAEIRRAVAEQHELQVHRVLLLKPGSLPKTSSGKIQRYACRAGFLDGGLLRSALSEAL